MKRLFGITGVMLLSTALFFVAVCAAGSMGTKHEWDGKGSKRVMGKWRGTDYVVGQCSTPYDGAFLVVNVGKGMSNVGGKSNLIAVACTGWCIDVSCEKIGSSGWMIVTGADGDALHLATDATLNPFTGEWTETEEIVGGTGRFENATGELKTKGNFILPTDADLFPYNAAPPIPPSLLQEPSFWVGTTEGWIMY